MVLYIFPMITCPLAPPAKFWLPDYETLLLLMALPAKSSLVCCGHGQAHDHVSGAALVTHRLESASVQVAEQWS